MNRILVIGGTGNIGREVVAQLVANGVGCRVLARNPDAVPLPAEAERIRADLAAPDTLDRALDGIETVFLVWTAPAAAFPPAFERIARQARRIVYLSAPLKTPHPFFQQPNPNSTLALRIESAIENSGLQWTFVRPGMFALDAVGFWAPQIRAGDVVRWPYLEAATAPIDERDIAAVAVRALCEDGHDRAEYVITGPDSLTQREQIEAIGDVIGRQLRIEELSPGEARSEVFAALPEPVVKMLFNAWGAAVGQPAYVSSSFAELMGRPPRSFRQWVSDHAEAFRGSAGSAATTR